jgi:hypothetical protein
MVVRLDPSALFVQSTRERYAGYFSARQAGFLTVNEIRDMEDLPSVGEVGDNILTPLNMAPTPVAPTPAVAIPEA